MVEVVKKKAKLADLKKEMTAVETPVQEAPAAEKPAEAAQPRRKITSDALKPSVKRKTPLPACLSNSAKAKLP